MNTHDKLVTLDVGAHVIITYRDNHSIHLDIDNQVFYSQDLKELIDWLIRHKNRLDSV